MSGSDRKTGIEVGPLGPPPAGFDPKTASAEQLRQLGWPRRPPLDAVGSQKKVWDLITQKSLRYVRPELREKKRAAGPNPRSPQPREKPLWNALTSQSWCGAQVSVPTAAYSFQDITGTWTVPAVSAPSNGSFSVAIWVGFGADPQNVVRVGSMADVGTGAFESDHYLFCGWETDGNPAFEAVTFNASPGDVVVVSLSLSGPTNGTAYFANQTLGIYTSAAVGGDSLSLATAQWMVERPTYNPAKGPTALADYGSVLFSAGSAGYVEGDPGSGNAETYVGLESAGPVWGGVTMVNDQNVILSTPEYDADGVECIFIKSD